MTEGQTELGLASLFPNLSVAWEIVTLRTMSCPDSLLHFRGQNPLLTVSEVVCYCDHRQLARRWEALSAE